MTGIVVPRPQLIQPQGRLQVARRWANNLRGAFLLRDRTVFDPISGLMLSGTGAQGVHPFGTAYDISATGHYIDTGVTDLGGVTLHAEDGVPFSVTIKFRTTTTGTIIARAGASVTLRTFQLFSNGTSQSPVVVVRGTQTTYNWGYQDGEWHTITVAWDGETVRVYGDSNREASFSRGTAVEETTQRILIGARSNGANFTLTGSSVEFTYVFDRALTRDEHLALVDNPYQVFRTERRLYAVEATGGAGPETGSGGSSSVVEVTSAGAGAIHVAGGSSSAVEVTSAGGGTASGAASGGSSSVVEVTSAGAGAAHVGGGSSSVVDVTSVGAGVIHATGGSSSVIEVTAAGAGIKTEAGPQGGSSSIVEVTSAGAGVIHVSGGSSSIVKVRSSGIAAAPSTAQLPRASLRSIKKRAIPQPTAQQLAINTAVKERLEVICGERGTSISTLPAGATLEQVVSKINEILALLQ